MTPIIGIPNPSNQSSSNISTLGSGVVYDKQGHIVTNGHVVGNAQTVDRVVITDQQFWKRILIVDDEADATITFKAVIEDSNSGVDVNKKNRSMYVEQSYRSIVRIQTEFL
jgi:hypothetical protein